MSGPPPPPRRSKSLKPKTITNNNSNDIIVGSGFNVAKSASSASPTLSIDTVPLTMTPSISVNQLHIVYNNQEEVPDVDIIDSMIPESVIGEGVNIKGDLHFDRLLRIDGSFDGTLISSGDLIIGPYGYLNSNLKDIATCYVLGGTIKGSVSVDNLILKRGSTIKGNITCKTITSEQYVTIIGRANIHPLAPEYVDANGNIIIDAPVVEIGVPHPPHKSHHHHHHSEKDKGHKKHGHHKHKKHRHKDGEDSDDSKSRTSGANDDGIIVINDISEEDKLHSKVHRKQKKDKERSDVGIIGDPELSLEDKLLAYFTAYDTTKIRKIPKLIQKYYGREEELLNSVLQKYGVLPYNEDGGQVQEQEDMIQQSTPFNSTLTTTLNDGTIDNQSDVIVAGTADVGSDDAGTTDGTVDASADVPVAENASCTDNDNNSKLPSVEEGVEVSTTDESKIVEIVPTSNTDGSAQVDSAT